MWFSLFYYQFPVSFPYTYLVGLMKFPIEVIVLFLLCIFSQEGRNNGNAIESVTCQFFVGIAFGKILDSG